jgi:hypothetical protein
MRFLRSLALTGPPRLAAALLVCLSITSVASAETVTFSTTGTFDGPPVSNTVLINGYEIRFDSNPGQTVNPVVGFDAFVDLGTFVVTQVGAGAANFSQAFTLDLTQTAPGAGAGQFVGSLSGNLIANAGGLSIDLAPNSFTFGAVTYTLLNDPAAVNALIVGTESDIRAAVSVVPVPAAAWAGMALFGLLGGAKLRRSRQSVMA